MLVETREVRKVEGCERRENLWKVDREEREG